MHILQVLWFTFQCSPLSIFSCFDFFVASSRLQTCILKEILLLWVPEVFFCIHLTTEEFNYLQLKIISIE